MSGSDLGKTLTDFWSAQGRAMLDAQQKATQTMAAGMQAMLTGQMPAMPGGSDGFETMADGLAKAGEATAELWAAATAASGDLTRALGTKIAGEGGLSTDVMERVTDPRQWFSSWGELDEVLGRVAEGPKLADLWDVERRYASVTKAWSVFRRRELEHSQLMLTTWLGATRRFLEELAGRSSAEGHQLDGKHAFALWTEVANRELLAAQRSDAFLASQREVIRASTALRKAQQDVAEHFAKQFGFPTRSELDDVHRSLTEMRRELRRLRRLTVTKAPGQ